MSVKKLKPISNAQRFRVVNNFDMVTKIINMVIKNEYKRRQYSPGVKLNPESFGRDRRFPIVSRFKY